MNSKIIFAFITGAAIGSGITWRLVKRKYEELAYDELADDEIASVKEPFGARRSEERNTVVDDDDYIITEEQAIQENIDEYKKLLIDKGYAVEDAEREARLFVENANPKEESKPYTIPPSEFGEYFDYELVTLRYYNEDNILTDENNEIVEDVEYVVGVDSLETFGEYQDETVYVRNDNLKSDYEIILEPGCFEGTSPDQEAPPHLMEE